MRERFKRVTTLLLAACCFPLAVYAQEEKLLDEEFKRHFAIEEEVIFETKLLGLDISSYDLGVVKVAPDRKIWVLNKRNSSLDIYSPEGEFLRSTSIKRLDTLQAPAILKRFNIPQAYSLYALKPFDLDFDNQGTGWGGYHGKGAFVIQFDGQGEVRNYFFIPRREPNSWWEKIEFLFLSWKEKHWSPTGENMAINEKGNLFVTGLRYFRDLDEGDRGKGNSVLVGRTRGQEFSLVHKFDPTGKPISSFLKLSENFTNQLNEYIDTDGSRPHIEIDQTGNLWVTVAGIPAVYKYSPQGTLLDSFSLQIPGYRPLKPFVPRGDDFLDSLVAWDTTWTQVQACYPILGSLLLVQYADPLYRPSLQLYDRKGKLLIPKMTRGRRIIQAEPDGSIYYLIPKEKKLGHPKFALVKYKFHWPQKKK
jgi:hypothetical protein